MEKAPWTAQQAAGAEEGKGSSPQAGIRQPSCRAEHAPERFFRSARLLSKGTRGPGPEDPGSADFRNHWRPEAGRTSGKGNRCRSQGPECPERKAQGRERTGKVSRKGRREAEKRREETRKVQKSCRPGKEGSQEGETGSRD